MFHLFQKTEQKVLIMQLNSGLMFPGIEYVKEKVKEKAADGKSYFIWWAQVVAKFNKSGYHMCVL